MDITPEMTFSGYAIHIVSKYFNLKHEEVEAFFTKCEFEFAIYRQKEIACANVTSIVCVPSPGVTLLGEELMEFFGATLSVTVYHTFVAFALATAQLYKESSCFLVFTDQRTAIVCGLIDRCDSFLTVMDHYRVRNALIGLREQLMQVYDQNIALSKTLGTMSLSEGMKAAHDARRYSWQYFAKQAGSDSDGRGVRPTWRSLKLDVMRYHQTTIHFNEPRPDLG